MISSNSLLHRANQAWKLRAMYLLMAAGGALMIFAKWQIHSLTPKHFAFFMLSGVGIALGSLVLACFAIGCPSCGSRWLWQAVSTKHSGSWLQWFLSQDACPTCGAFPRDAA